MSLLRFERKDPAEKVVLTFDLTPELANGETLTGVVTATVVVGSVGTDPHPEAILNGATSIDSTGKMALVPVQGGLNGVDYIVKALVGTTNPSKVLALSGVLPVRS